MAKMSMKKFDRMVTRKVMRAMSKVTTHRVYISVAPTASAVNNYSLLVADDDPDYEILTNGTTIAECQTNSKIVKISLGISYYTNGGAGGVNEFIVYRDPDNELGSVDPQNAFSVAESALQESKRKNILVYRANLLSASGLVWQSRTAIKEKALRRARLMQDNDRLKLSFTTGAGATQKLLVQGRIWTRFP